MCDSRYRTLSKVLRILYTFGADEKRVSTQSLKSRLRKICQLAIGRSKFRVYYTCVKPDLKWHGDRCYFATWDKVSRETLERHFRGKKRDKDGYTSMGDFLHHFFEKQDSEDIMLVPNFKSRYFVSSTLKTPMFHIESAIVALVRHGVTGITLVFVGSIVNLGCEMKLFQDFRNMVLNDTGIAPIVLTKWFLVNTYSRLKLENKFLRDRFHMGKSEKDATGKLDIHEHSLRIARLAVILSSRQGFTPLDRLRIYACGIMHDTGKEKVSDNGLRILTRKSKSSLCRGDKTKYEQHPLWSAERFLGIFSEWPEWAIPIMCHHDKNASAEADGLGELRRKFKELGFVKKSVYKEVKSNEKYKTLLIASDILRMADELDEDIERLRRHKPYDVEANLDRFRKDHSFPKEIRNALEDENVVKGVKSVLQGRKYGFPQNPKELRDLLLLR